MGKADALYRVWTAPKEWLCDSVLLERRKWCCRGLFCGVLVVFFLFGRFSFLSIVSIAACFFFLFLNLFFLISSSFCLFSNFTISSLQV